MAKNKVRTYTYFNDHQKVSLEEDGVQVMYFWGDCRGFCEDCAHDWMEGDSVEDLERRYSYDGMVETDPEELKE